MGRRTRAPWSSGRRAYLLIVRSASSTVVPLPEVALEVAAKKGRGESARESVLMAKIYATEMAVRVCDAAMRTFGGWGYSKDHIVERLYRDSLANVPAGLPTDRLRELLACAMVDVDPWRYEPFAPSPG